MREGINLRHYDRKKFIIEIALVGLGRFLGTAKGEEVAEILSKLCSISEVDR